MSAETERGCFLPVSAQSSIDSFVEMAQRAESLGYDRVWMPETWGRDIVTVLATIANETETVGIGSSIINTYSRSPALIGQTAATLQELSDGRFRLGVGPSGPIVIENWHGMDYGNPLRQTRETIEIVRQVLSGETVEYDGEIFSLSGFNLRSDPPETPVGIDAAAMGPKAVELAGRFGDGWHATMLTTDGLRDRIEDFRRGRELGGKDADGGHVLNSVTTCALEDGERARDLVRGHVAFYIGAMGTFYREALIDQGHEDVAETVTENWQNGDREAAKAAIDDELLDSLAAAGTPEYCRERIEAFESMDGVDAVSVSFPRAASGEEVIATIEAVAPE